ncbi:MAG: hypothetical protein NPIRA05_01130 [Nitrospirales bacterium]|nr:MAG: hypothetical protein NPIRA05_01130 [Nitrospirales bacterium]
MTRFLGMNKPEVENVARRIEDYLLGHPNAADNVEGIARWWLTQESDRQALYEVEAALRLLIQRGIVRKTVMVDGSAIYGRDQFSKDQDED